MSKIALLATLILILGAGCSKDKDTRPIEYEGVIVFVSGDSMIVPDAIKISWDGEEGTTGIVSLQKLYGGTIRRVALVPDNQIKVVSIREVEP